MTVLQQRFFFGALSLVVVFGLLGLDHWQQTQLGMVLLLAFFALGGWFEFTRLADCRGVWTRLVGFLGIGGLLFAMWAMSMPWILDNMKTARTIVVMSDVIPALVPLLLVAGMLRTTPSSASLHRTALAVLGFVYLWYPAQCCFRLYTTPDLGLASMALLVLLVKGNDIGAFLVGRSFGKTPLTKVSPNKTVEGSLGGLALGLIVALCFATIPAEPIISIGMAVVLGVVVGIAGQLGDLAESFLKRAAGAKDSGNLLPAFGGILDLLDSVWFALPIYYWLLRGGDVFVY